MWTIETAQLIQPLLTLDLETMPGWVGCTQRVKTRPLPHWTKPEWALLPYNDGAGRLYAFIPWSVIVDALNTKTPLTY